MDVALGRDFLKWGIPEAYKAMYFSMDMANSELMHFSQIMKEGLSQVELAALEQRFKIIPMGEAIHLDKPANQVKIERTVDRYKPDIIFFDTFGTIIGDNINSKEVVDVVLEFLKKLHREHDTTTWLLHHNRKPQIGNKKPVEIYDVFGSQYIGNSVSTAIGLWQGPVKNVIEVKCLKSRITPAWPDFNIQRTETLDFKVTDNTQKAPQGERSEVNAANSTKSPIPM